MQQAACLPSPVITWQSVALAAVVAVQAIATAWMARRNTREHRRVERAVERNGGH